jgi:hypothetical protein
MFGVDKGKKPFQPFFKPKLEPKAVEHLQEEKAPKVESAIGEILPKKRGRPRKEEHPEEFVGQRRRRFAIKKVTQIKSKKDK